jgi:predicted DNA-binding protein with PD1-like motif
VKVETSERARHLVLRAEAGDVLPDALVRVLREHRVVAGWLRGSGVLSEIELRAYGADIVGHGVGRRVAGPAQVLVLDGALGIADGDVSLALRGVFARETDQGVETLAGEITAARVVALEAVVTVIDDVAMPRGLDPDAGIWLMTEPAGLEARGGGAAEGNERGAPDTPRTPAPFEKTPYAQTPPKIPAPRPPSPAWSEAIAASATPAGIKDKGPQIPGGTRPMHQPIPIRPVVTGNNFDDGPFPEAGDMVEHFAFGTCEVLKSDGDRLHLKVGKDGRIREIALEMLRVTLLTSDGETQRYRLDRKM